MRGWMANLVTDKTVDLLRRRTQLVLIPVRHGAKFDEWLRYGVAAALAADPRIKRVEAQRP